MPSKIKLTWQNPNSDLGRLFIFKSRHFIEQSALPEPFAIIENPSTLEYEDSAMLEGDSYWYMLAFGQSVNRVFSNAVFVEVAFNDSEPSHLTAIEDNGNIQLNWQYTRLIDDGFNYYNYHTSMSDFSMLSPKAVGITGLSYLDTSYNKKRKNFFKIGIVKGIKEYFSNEVELNTQYPYELSFNVVTGKLETNWVHDDPETTTFNYYCENSSINENALPTAKATGLTATSYIDLTTSILSHKYVRIGAVIEGVEYVSDEFIFKIAPHNLNVVNENGKLVISWEVTHDLFDSFNYYCESSSFDNEDLESEPLIFVPKATDLIDTEYTDLITNVQSHKYIRIGAVMNGVEYFSEPFIYNENNPYKINTVWSANNLVSTWKCDDSEFDYFNYYCEESPILINALPIPKASNLTTLTYTDTQSSMYGRKYIRIGVVKNSVEQISEEFIYIYKKPYLVNSAVVLDQFVTSWKYDGESTASFNYYCSSSPINVGNDPEDESTIASPQVTSLTGESYIDPSMSVYGRKYVHIGAVVNGVEYISDQFIYEYFRPYDLDIEINTNTIVATWKYDRAIDDGFNFYCEESPIDENNLPTAKETEIMVKTHSETGINPLTTYYIRIGVVRNGMEYLSDEFDTSTL